MNSRLSWLLCFCFLISGCSPRAKKEIPSSQELKYANNLFIETTDYGKRLTIQEPYRGGKPISYILTNHDQVKKTKDTDIIIPLPLTSLIGTSTSQIGFIELLSSEDLITGFTTTDFISSQTIRALIKKGSIMDIGRDANINLESLVALDPDLVFAYSVSGNVDQWDRIAEAGIPIIFDASYLETSPLAQAEWIKFIGVLVGRQQQADSIFKAIENNYLNLLTQVSSSKSPPKVIAGSMYNGTWFMPGGKSWVATYIEQAGGQYLWKEIDQSGSVPLGFESVYEKGLQANLWIGATAYKSYEQLILEDDRYLKFKAVRDSAIYAPTKRVNEFGGNDYYESGVARPDLVLKDFIKILNPDLFPDYNLIYYRKLN